MRLRMGSVWVARGDKGSKNRYRVPDCYLSPGAGDRLRLLGTLWACAFAGSSSVKMKAPQHERTTWRRWFRVAVYTIVVNA